MKKVNIGVTIGVTLGCLTLVALVSFIVAMQWRRRRVPVLKPAISPFVAAADNRQAAAQDTRALLPHFIKQASTLNQHNGSDPSRHNHLAAAELEQRLTIMHNQIHEHHNRLAEATARLQQSPTYYTDSGIRFVDSNGQVPPNYTPS